VSEDTLVITNPEKFLADPQQLNSYSYSRNNPINDSDPSGQSLIGENIDGLIGTGVGLVQGTVNTVIGALALPFLAPAIMSQGYRAGVELTGALYNNPGQTVNDIATGISLSSKEAWNQFSQQSSFEQGRSIGDLGGNIMGLALLGAGAKGAVESSGKGESSVPQNLNGKTIPNLENLSPKINKQMGQRGWTPEQIKEAFDYGKQVSAVNKANGNSSTRYIHPDTGQSVVIENKTGEVIHVGGKGFKYGLSSGDIKK